VIRDDDDDDDDDDKKDGNSCCVPLRKNLSWEKEWKCVRNKL